MYAADVDETHMSWWQQVPVLSEFKCITIDHRTGRSPTS